MSVTGLFSEERTPSIARTSLRRYLLAILLVCLCTVFAVALNQFSTSAPFIYYLPAILIILAYCRLGPTLLAIFLSALSVDYFLTPPLYTFSFNARDVFNEALFVVSMSIAADAIERYRTRVEATDLLQNKLLESASEPILITNGEHEVVYWNGGAERLYGWTKSEATGKDPDKLLASAYPAPKDEVEKLLNDHGFWRGTLVRRSKSGDEIVTDSSWSLERQSGFILQTDLDITEWNKADRAVREAQAKLVAAMESMNDAVFVSDSDGTFIDFNEAFVTFHRFRTREECRQRLADYPAILEVYSTDGNLLPLEQWAVPRCLRGERGTNVEFGLRRKDTGEKWVGSYSFAPIRDGSGNIVGSVVSARDVTTQKQAESALRDSEEDNRVTFEQAGVGICHVSMDDRWLRFNDKFCSILGYTREELLSMRAHDIILPDDVEVDRELPHEVRDGKAKSHCSEKRCIRKDGSIVWTNLTVSLARDASGEPSHYIYFMEDITARRQAETQLLQVQKLDAIGSLAGGIAHDFNNLLMVIMAETELLGEQLRGTARRRAESIMASAIRGAELTRQLLAFSRKQTTQPVVSSVNQIVTNMAQMTERLIGEDIDVRLKLRDGLWPVKIDRSQFEQAIMNLVLNARDAMPDGGVLEIATTNWEVSRGPYASKFKTPAGKYVLLTISDNGSGMSPETKTHLFEPFYTTKEPGKGTGLGLAMVYGTIKKANGFIYADSEPGEGARFKIYLPAVDGAVQVQGKPTVAAGKGVRRKATILLVEDESNLRNLMAEFLSSGGHAVFTADGPENARKIALEQNGTIDVLLTDVVLKEGNGRQLAQQLSEAGCTFKVVYVSGYTPEAIIHRGILEPGIPFLQKPFGRQVLLDKIEEILVG